MIKCDFDEIQIVDINDDISRVGEILLSTRNETIFVTDLQQHLYGIITMNEFLRKAVSSQKISDLMNENYVKIRLDEIINTIEETAVNIFNGKTRINDIPIIDNEGRLLYSFKRENFQYSMETIENVLKLRNNNNDLIEYLNLIDIKTIVIIILDEFLNLIYEVLNKYFEIMVYKSYDDYYRDKKKADLVLVQDKGIFKAQKIMFEGMFVCDIRDLFSQKSLLTKTIEQINILGKITNNILLFRIPHVAEVKNKSASELEFIYKAKKLDTISVGMNINEKNRTSYENKVIQIPGAITKGNDICFRDYQSEYFNVINGRRITTDDIDGLTNKIYVLGNSVVYGYGSEDKNTIPSFMQRILNASKSTYKVINCGTTFRVSLYNVISEVKKGDKIIMVLGGYLGEILNRVFYKFSYIQYHSLNYLFDRPHEMGELYFDRRHINYLGNNRVAREIINIMDNYDDVGIVKCNGEDIIKREDNEKLMEEGLGNYLENIIKLKVNFSNIGAIVMNCNPFTYGHKYLIEYALNQVEHLFIFVVEEDKSYFKFEDRFELIKAGTKDLTNITVLSSGRFIISTITFDEYFSKDDLQDVTIDPTKDIEIFARHIAPALGITKRFAGEEPNCNITNQYNNTMKKIFPKYGIDFIEIPRKEYEGKPISASTVRNMMDKKDARSIKSLVPPATYDYIAKLL